MYGDDAENGLIADINQRPEEVAAFRADCRHHRTAEPNSDAHLKSLLVRHQVAVLVTDGKLDLDAWRRVYYSEFDGMLPKRVLLKVIRE